MFKVLILLSVFFSIGKVQDISSPKMTYQERFLNLQPSKVHSIKGKFYEEKQINIPKFETDTKAMNKSEKDMAKNLHDELVHDEHNLKTGESNVHELKLQRNRSDITRTSKLLSQVPNANETQTSLIDGQNISRRILPKLHFQAEKAVSNYDKNDTIQTVKRELTFDSLLIQNNDNNNVLESPNNITSSNVNNEINPEADIFYNATMLPEKDSRRWFPPNGYYAAIPPPVLELPNTVDNNVVQNIPKFEHTNFVSHLPKNKELGSAAPIKQHDKDMYKIPCESSEIFERSSNNNDIQLKEPTKGVGITNVVKSRMMLLNHPRVCYACSSINDPSCWSADRSTAVKYCRTDHPSCLTKVYKFKGLSYIMRDCGNVCEQAASSQGPKYTACTICHHDLCNSASDHKITLTFLLYLFVYSLYDKIL